MKELLLFSLIIAFSALQAQTSHYTANISRNNLETFSVVDAKKNVQYELSRNEENQRILIDEGSYRVIDGKGWKKNEKGERPRNYRILINSKEDSILISKPGGRIESDQGLVAMRTKTESGWTYTDTEDQIICNVQFTWNKKIWHYEIDFLQDDSEHQDLKRLIFVEMVPLAYRRSKAEEDDWDEDFWFTMWVISQNQ